MAEGLYQHAWKRSGSSWETKWEELCSILKGSPFCPFEREDSDSDNWGSGPTVCRTLREGQVAHYQLSKMAGEGEAYSPQDRTEEWLEDHCAACGTYRLWTSELYHS